MYCQTVRVVFNFAETVLLRNLQSKSHAKFKAFTGAQNHTTGEAKFNGSLTLMGLQYPKTPSEN